MIFFQKKPQLLNVLQKDYLNSYEIIKQRKQNWETTSEPQFFIRKGEDVTMIIYKNEGVIFKRVTY